MITIYDRASMAHVLTLALDPLLHRLLERLFANLFTADGDLTDWTEYLVIRPGDTERDIIREVGFSPLVEPIDGARFPGKGFYPFWAHLVAEDGWYVLTQTFGSTFAYILLIEDADGVIPELRCMCRRFAETRA